MLAILGEVDGTYESDRLLKGCGVRWLISCERVARLVVNPAVRLEFIRLCKEIRNMSELDQVYTTFKKITTLCSELVTWAEWWLREDNLKLLCVAFSNRHWENTPDSTNIIESLN